MANQSLTPGVDFSINTKKDQEDDEVYQSRSCTKCMGCMNALIPRRR